MKEPISMIVYNKGVSAMNCSQNFQKETTFERRPKGWVGINKAQGWMLGAFLTELPLLWWGREYEEFERMKERVEERRE